MGTISHSSTEEGASSPKEVVKFLAVIAGITVVSSFLVWQWGSISPISWMRWFMGVFFLVFGSFKLVGYSMFIEMFGEYDVVAKRIPGYAAAYPFIEILLAALYFTNAVPPVRDASTFAIMAVSSIGVTREILRRSGIHCACLGNVIRLPLSTVSLIEDVGMGLMALFMLVWGR